jgi:hypothetical protein
MGFGASASRCPAADAVVVHAAKIIDRRHIGDYTGCTPAIHIWLYVTDRRQR